MKNPFLKWLFMLSCLITSLAAINNGLYIWGYNFFNSNFVLTNLAQFVPIMYYIVLAAGIISLAGFVMCASGNCCNGKSCCK